MQLFFRPVEKKYEGEGILPHGTFDNTNDWNPLIKYLEKGAIDFPDKTMFKMGDANARLLNNLHIKRPIKNPIKLQITLSKTALLIVKIK